MAKPEINTYPVPLSGKLINSVDGILIGKNFTTLKNMRYTDANLRGVKGMTQINTSAITHTDIKNGFHYRKPDESHVLVQGYSGSTSSLYYNSTAVPGTGSFTELYIEDTSATGYFSNAPQGELIYCNSEESLIWNGDESRCASFCTTNSAETYWRDYTEEANNELDDENNIAVVGTVAPSADTNTMLLLHLNNDVVDASPTTPHTVTNNSVTFDGADKVFGTYSAVFDGSTAYLSVPNDADCDFSSGVWTLDTRIKLTSLASSCPIYHHKTDSNNFMNILVSAAGQIAIQLIEAGSFALNSASATGIVTTGTWYHVEVAENGNNYYVFIDGVLKHSATSSARPLNYTGTPYIGFGPSLYLNGRLDEFRISNVARHVLNFTIPIAAYGTPASATSVLYIGSLMPLSGYTINVKTPNSQTSTLSTEYWDGSAWVSVNNESDGTAAGGITFAQSGVVSFDDTRTTTTVKSIKSLVVYWYKASITAIDASTSVYNVTTRYEMQNIKDIWDGAESTCFNFQLYKSSAYSDNTFNVTEINYSSANTATYADVSSVTTSDYLLCGFNKRATGINVVFAEGNVNSNAATVTVSYWDGASWVATSGLDDGTSDGTNTLAKSGSITWSAPAKTSEFKTEIAKETQRYYYKVAWSAALSVTVFIDQVTGISAQTEIEGFNFPVHGLGRVWLCKDNYALYSAFGTTQVFNGEDSASIYFGDSKELVAATTLYSLFGNSVADVMVFTKQDETWVLISSEGVINRYRVSESIGCVAPLTMKSTHIEGELSPGINRNIAIWQGAQGVYIFDGRVPLPIHHDIRQYFDRSDAAYINADVIDKSVGFFNEDGTEYHWLFANGTSTTLNKELVYNVTKQRWFEIDRGTKLLQAGWKAKDTLGVTYNYGALNTGYVELLEDGTTFDGDAIGCEFQFGDMALVDELTETELRKVKLFTKAQTGNDITITHYGDTSTTGNSYTASPDKTGYRMNEINNDKSFKHHIFHSLKVESDIPEFEPLHMALGFKLSRRD